MEKILKILDFSINFAQNFKKIEKFFYEIKIIYFQY